MNRFVFSSLLLLSCLMSACQLNAPQLGDDPLVTSSSLAESTQSLPNSVSATDTPAAGVPASVTPNPTATPLPPTATASPSQTETSTVTRRPSMTPLPTKTSIPTPSLTPTATLPPLGFEWLPPSYLDTEPGLLSISGGILHGFEYEAPYLIGLLGKSLAVYDMDVEPYAAELARIPLQDSATDMVRSDRFLYLTQADHVLVVDISELPDIRPVARLDGLWPGRLYLGRDESVYFTDTNRRTWQLDVDPELPAKQVIPPPNEARSDSAEEAQAMVYALLDQIGPQFKQLYPDTNLTLWVDIIRDGDELLVGYATSGEGGGGAVLRVDLSDIENPLLLSAFKTFTPKNIAVNQDIVATGFVNETASELSLVDVSTPTQPQLIGSLPYHSSGLALSGDGVLFASNRPGLATVQLDQTGADTLIGSMSMEQTFSGYLQQMVLDPTETLLFGLPGLYEKGGLVIVSVEDLSRPEFLAELWLNWHQIAYHNDTIYGVDHRTLKLVDVTDPTLPELTHEIPIDGTVGGFALWEIEEDDRLIAAVLTEQDLQMIDVTDPDESVVLGRLETPGQCVRLPDKWGYIWPYDRALSYIDGMLYSPLGRCNLFRIDVSDLSSPRIVGSLTGDGSPVLSDGLLYVGGSNLSVYEMAR